MKAKLAFAGLGAAALIAGGYWSGAANFPSSHAAAATPAAQVAPQVASPAAVQTLPDFTTIVEGNKAAVVNITSTMKAKASEDEDESARHGRGRSVLRVLPPLPGADSAAAAASNPARAWARASSSSPTA